MPERIIRLASLGLGTGAEGAPETRDARADSGKAGGHDVVQMFGSDRMLQAREWPPMEARRQHPALWAGLFIQQGSPAKRS